MKYNPSLSNLLKQRGLEDVLLCVTDGLNGMPEPFGNVYSQAKWQQCLVHLNRKISSRVKISDCHEIINDFKELHSAKNLVDVQNILNEFCSKWELKYTKLIQSIKNSPNFLTFLSFPKAIPASIYSTNLIEIFNEKLKHHIKKREQF